MRNLPPSAAAFAADLILWVCALFYIRLGSILTFLASWKAILKSDHQTLSLPERIKLLQDVCVFGNCLPGFVGMSIPRESGAKGLMARAGARAEIAQGVVEGQMCAVREERWISAHTGGKYFKWLYTQVLYPGFCLE